MAFSDWLGGVLPMPFLRQARKKREAEKKLMGKQGKASKRDRKSYKKEQKEYKKGRAFEKREYQAQKKLFQKAHKKYGGEKFKQYPSQTKEQRGLLDYLSKYGRGETGLQGALKEAPLYKAGESALLDLFKTTPEAYEQFKAPMMKEFERDIIPKLVAQGRGAGGSALQGSLTQAASGLGERLGTLREQLRQSAIGQALGYAQQPVSNQMSAAGMALGTDPFVNIYRPPTIPGMTQSPSIAIPQRPPAQVQVPKSPGFMGNLLQSLAPAAGMAAGTAIGGPIGGAIGGGLGSMFGQSLAPRQQQQQQPFNYAMPQRQQMPSFGQFEQGRRAGFNAPFLR